MSDDLAIAESYFLSYSRADERFALRFATDLRAGGVSMWVDQFDIRPSEHWDRAIERAVRDCCGLVVILSPRSVASDNVADEISFAIDSGKPVLPVMIERCTLPLRITRMQMIDATGNYERALQQCLEAIGGKEPLPSRRGEPSRIQGEVPDVEVIAAAKSQLTDILGPIAAILVEKAAARSNSASDLYTRLAQHIESEKDRERFMKLAGRQETPSAAASKPSTPNAAKLEQSSVAQPEVDRLALLLTHYLGPMAAMIARREGALAASADEFQERLASQIPNERERADFLRRVRSASD